MEMVEISGYLPDTATSAKHKTAVAMEQVIRVMVEANSGSVASFDVRGRGTALLFVIGDEARQAVIREFRRLERVVVKEVPALAVHQETNAKVQERANRMREARKKKAG